MKKSITLETLHKLKANQEKITSLTAYDASFARLLSQQGIEILLVGDSLGNVIQGHSNTIPVTIADMVYHTQAVARGNQGSFLIADMPFLSYCSGEQALENAGQLLRAGAHCVKLEGGKNLLSVAAKLREFNVPVCAHIGLSGQAVYQESGYKIQGTNEDAAAALYEDAMALEKAGVSLFVIECVPAALAAKITAALKVPAIGIGAGVDCDGQILVTYDILGIDAGVKTKFVKNFLDDLERPSIQLAVNAYYTAVKSKTFPSSEHSF